MCSRSQVKRMFHIIHKNQKSKIAVRIALKNEGKKVYFSVEHNRGKNGELAESLIERNYQERTGDL